MSLIDIVAAVVGDPWYCPYCGRKSTPFNPSSWWSSLSYTLHGLVCRRCEKEHGQEIREWNESICGRPGARKDPTCEHDWAHPIASRWFCRKCGAVYNLMCGCGGSKYVCHKHAQQFLAEHPDLPAFLAEHSY